MDDRGVSPVVSYVLALGIVTLLLSGLIVTFAPLVSNQQQAAAGATFEVIGNDLAGDIESVDRLAGAAGESGAVEYRTDLPDRVGGSPYEIEIEPGGGDSTDVITVRSVDHDGEAIVELRTRTAIDVGPESESVTLDGGTVRIHFDGEQLVIENV